MVRDNLKQSRSKILEFKRTNNPSKLLGTFLSYYQNKNVEQNFVNRIRKMKTKLSLWLSTDLTLYSRVSQLIYAASMLSFPTSVIKNAQAELFNFLYKNKKDKIKRLVMFQPLAKGGLNFVKVTGYLRGCPSRKKNICALS